VSCHSFLYLEWFDLGFEPLTTPFGTVTRKMIPEKRKSRGKYHRTAILEALFFYDFGVAILERMMIVNVNRYEVLLDTHPI